MVAEVDGPFAVDLHKGGPLADADGATMDAVPVAALTGHNKEGNDAFDPTTKYAFGFEVVAATARAKNVNLDAADLTDYQEMVTKGYTTLLVGTATWKGNNNGTLHRLGLHADHRGAGLRLQRAPHDDQVPASGSPRRRSTATRRTRRSRATPFPNEEHPRGIQTVGQRVDDRAG